MGVILRTRRVDVVRVKLTFSQSDLRCCRIRLSFSGVCSRIESELNEIDSGINSLVDAGHLRRIAALRMLHVRDEEWFLEPISGDIYVNVRPDDKILPTWEKVDIFAPTVAEESKDIRVAGLKIIPTGEINSQTATGLQWLLSILVEQGKLEIIPPTTSLNQGSSGNAETWYREYATGDVYRLIERDRLDRSFWELLSPSRGR